MRYERQQHSTIYRAAGEEGSTRSPGQRCHRFFISGEEGHAASWQMLVRAQLHAEKVKAEVQAVSFDDKHAALL